MPCLTPARGSGTWKKHRGAFKELKASNITPNIVTFTTMVHLCTKKKDIQGAEKWLTLMIESGHEMATIPTNAIIALTLSVLNIGSRKCHWLSQMPTVTAQLSAHMSGKASLKRQSNGS